MVSKMSESNLNYWEIKDWRCPACHINTNSQGILCESARAIALHVAGKIRGGDNTHKKWAISNIGNVIYDPEVNKTINTLADAIKSTVITINLARIKQEEERIQLIIEEREASEEPKVLAYRYIGFIETNLHQFICKTLQEAEGMNENEWWVKSVPTNIRIECAKRREEDNQGEVIYNYTNLIDLKTIIEKIENYLNHIYS